MVRRSGKERSGKECRPSQQFPSEVLHNKPQLFKEAMRSDDSCWHEAIKVEMNSNRGNGTGIMRCTSGVEGPNIEMEVQAKDEGGRFDRAVHDRSRSRLRRNLFTTGPLCHGPSDGSLCEA